MKTLTLAEIMKLMDKVYRKRSTPAPNCHDCNTWPCVCDVDGARKRAQKVTQDGPPGCRCIEFGDGFFCHHCSPREK